MTQSRPLISVVVPTFQRPDYLRTALASVVTQTYDRLEVIVGDDGGDDETADVVASFGDQRLRYLPRPRRLGMLHNIVDALRSATGRYIIKLDDDDFWHESLCQKLLAPLEADDELSVAFCDHWLVDESGTVRADATEANSRRWGRAELSPGKHRPFTHLAIEGTLPVQFAAMFRREAIGLSHFPEAIGGVYDRWLACLASREGAGAFYVDERLAYYRVHGGMDTIQGRLRVAREKGAAYERLLEDPLLAEVRPRVRQLLSQYDVDLALGLLRSPAAKESRALARRSLALRPSARGAVALGLSRLPHEARERIFVGWEAVQLARSRRLALDYSPLVLDRAGDRPKPRDSR